MTGEMVGGGVGQFLEDLVRVAPRRPPGSAANRAATSYVTRTLRAAGMDPQELPFRSRAWTPGRAHLAIDGTTHAIEPPPFCRTASVTGSAVLLGSTAELEGVGSAPGRVIVLSGELAT
ncbi:MAG TPA: hypothetical protein VFX65_02630, partial [Candidatus Limnocylindrales bacterium]|nr:hypothetical protein [Candidatus Limnocylindrales bacterium]